LQCVAVCVALCLTVLQCVAVCCSVLQCVAVCVVVCVVVCVALCLTVLQFVAVCCSVCCSVCCTVFDCVAVCSSVFQCVAVCCSVCCSVCCTVCCTVFDCVWLCCSVLQCVLQCALQCVLHPGLCKRTYQNTKKKDSYSQTCRKYQHTFSDDESIVFGFYLFGRTNWQRLRFFALSLPLAGRTRNSKGEGGDSLGGDDVTIFTWGGYD